MKRLIATALRTQTRRLFAGINRPSNANASTTASREKTMKSHLCSFILRSALLLTLIALKWSRLSRQEVALLKVDSVSLGRAATERRA